MRFQDTILEIALGLVSVFAAIGCVVCLLLVVF